MSGILQAYATYQEQKQYEEQAEAEASWHRYNAQIAKKEAEAEREASAFEEKQQRRKAKQILARQRALVGASGATMEGSPLIVAEDTAGQLALESMNIRKTGTRRAGTYESLSLLETSKARAAKKRAKYYGKAAYWRAGASLLGSTGQAVSMGASAGA